MAADHCGTDHRRDRRRLADCTIDPLAWKAARRDCYRTVELPILLPRRNVHCGQRRTDGNHVARAVSFEVTDEP